MPWRRAGACGRVSRKHHKNGINEKFAKLEKHSENNAVLGEVDVLRQQVATADLERTREREQLTDRIESLQQMLADEKSAPPAYGSVV